MARNSYSTNYQNGGAVSEWNEGNLKNLRLHEAQELINFGKSNPLIKFNEEWKYKMWIDGINILYGEGSSKYSDTEIKEIEKVKEILFKALVIYPIHLKKVNKIFNDIHVKYSLNEENWEKVKKYIELFERRVKYFNDLHGLSTRNYDYDDEGL